MLELIGEDESILKVDNSLCNEDEASIYLKVNFRDSVRVIVNIEEIYQIVDALYAAAGREVIPLREELIAFATFNDPDGQYIEQVVDDYLASLEEEDAE